MLNWLRRRRLSSEARKQLMLLRARSEEALVETHVNNLFDLFDTLGDEIDLDRGMSLYLEMMDLDESSPMATAVTNRLLARLRNPSGAREKRRLRSLLR